MRESNEDLWSYYGHPNTAVVITTNGVVKKDGACVMGRGTALQAKQRFPGIDYKLGSLIRAYDNHVHLLREERRDQGTLVAFPVKHCWWEEADLGLIERSAQELLSISKIFKWDLVVLPRPGCGNGRRDWSEVKPILEKYFDDQFLVCSL